jgi:hypothetical protein
MQNKISISSYYRAVLKSLEEEVVKSNDQYIRETETSQIMSNLLRSEHVLIPIEFDSTKKESMRHEKEMRVVPAHARDEFYNSNGGQSFEYETIWITIPIVPNTSIQKTKSLGTTTYTMSWSASDFNWNTDYVTLSLDIKGYGFKYEDQQVVNEVTNLKNRVHEWVGWANTDIEQGNVMLQKELIPFIENRKKKLDEDGSRLNNLSEKIGITLE